MSYMFRKFKEFIQPKLKNLDDHPAQIAADADPNSYIRDIENVCLSISCAFFKEHEGDVWWSTEFTDFCDTIWTSIEKYPIEQRAEYLARAFAVFARELRREKYYPKVPRRTMQPLEEPKAFGLSLLELMAIRDSALKDTADACRSGQLDHVAVSSNNFTALAEIYKVVSHRWKNRMPQWKSAELHPSLELFTNFANFYWNQSGGPRQS